MTLIDHLTTLETELRDLGNQLEQILEHEQAETRRCRAARRDYTAAQRRTNEADAAAQIRDALNQ